MGGSAVPLFYRSELTILVLALTVFAPAVSVRHSLRSLWTKMAASCNPLPLLIASTWYRVHADHSTVLYLTVSLWLGNGRSVGYYRVKRSRESPHRNTRTCVWNTGAGISHWLSRINYHDYLPCLEQRSHMARVVLDQFRDGRVRCYRPSGPPRESSLSTCERPNRGSEEANWPRVQIGHA
jgi:hypothetical protein